MPNTNTIPVGSTFLLGDIPDRGEVKTFFLVVTKNSDAPGWSFGDDEIEVCFGYQGNVNYFYESEWGDGRVVNVAKVSREKEGKLRGKEALESLSDEEIQDMKHAYELYHGSY